MSSRLRSGQLAAGYTDAMAVAANRAAVQYGSDSTRAVIPITGTSRGTANTFLLTNTPVLEAGIYTMSLVVVLTGTNSGTKVGTALELDGVDFGLDILSESIVVGGAFAFGAELEVDFTGSTQTHTIETVVWQPSSPGSVTTELSSAIWVRRA